MSADRNPLLALLDEWLAKVEGDYVAGVEAAKFVAWCQEAHGDVLLDFLVQTAPSIITQRIALRDRHNRAVSRSGAAAFADAVERLTDGDPETMSAFEVVFVVDEKTTRRRVGDMTGSDHRFVASGYTLESNRQKLFAAFHLAVAKRLGERKTSDAFTEAQYLALQASLFKRSDKAPALGPPAAAA